MASEELNTTVDLGRVVGIDGKSAYQTAVEGGYTGTEEEFAEFLASRQKLPDNILSFEPADPDTPPEPALPKDADMLGGYGPEHYVSREELLTMMRQFADVTMSGGVPYGKELTESWESMNARIVAGDLSGIHIGDYKTIQLTTGETVIMEVAGIDQYYRCADQEIGHHVDFISRDCLAGTKVWNDTNTNNGTAAEPNPWRASKLFRTLNDETTGVFSTLPAELKLCVIEKRALVETRYSETGTLNDSTSWKWDNMGKLWLPTEVEVLGNTVWSDASIGAGGGGCNKQYPIFIGNCLHLIKGNGDGGPRRSWLEASARRASATDVCYVGADGANGYIVTYERLCVPLCFRIGRIPKVQS